MTRIVVMRLALFLLSVSAFADPLTLKDGRVLSGTYLGGSTTVLRFLVGDRVETYPIAASGSDRLWRSQSCPRSGGVPFGLPPHDTRTANDTNALTTPDAAEKQQRFCDVLQSYRESVMRYTNESNAIRRAAMRKPDPFDWEDRIMAFMGTSGRFDNWHGTVRFHVEGQWVAVSFFPDCKGFGQAIDFSTAQHYRLKENETLIPFEVSSRAHSGKSERQSGSYRFRSPVPSVGRFPSSG